MNPFFLIETTETETLLACLQVPKFSLSEAFLLHELPLLYGSLGHLCLVGECLPYVDTLVEVDLEGELYGAPFAKT